MLGCEEAVGGLTRKALAASLYGRDINSRCSITLMQGQRKSESWKAKHGGNGDGRQTHNPTAGTRSAPQVRKPPRTPRHLREGQAAFPPSPALTCGRPGWTGGPSEPHVSSLAFKVARIRRNNTLTYSTQCRHLGIPQSILAIMISGRRTCFKANQQSPLGRC